MAELTINDLVDMAYGTAKANGWHDRKGERLANHHAYAKLSALTPTLLALGRVIESIRKPAPPIPGGPTVIGQLWCSVNGLTRTGLLEVAADHLAQTSEEGALAEGSKAEAIAWMVLVISEAVEAIEAILKGDKANFAEEVADIKIRLGDDVGAINDTPGHFLGPIDLQEVIRAKNERNKARGYRHGGKQA